MTLTPLRPSLFALSAVLFATTSGFVAESAAQSVRWTPLLSSANEDTPEQPLPEFNTPPLVQDTANPALYTYAGKELIFPGLGPGHGTFTLANASIIYRGEIRNNRQPVYQGTGKVVFDSKYQGEGSSFRFRLRDEVTFVFTKNSSDPLSHNSRPVGSDTFISLDKNCALALERDVDLTQGSRSLLSIGHVVLDSRTESQLERAPSLIRIRGPHSLKIQNLQFNCTYDQTLILDGSTVLVEAPADTPFGMFSYAGGAAGFTHNVVRGNISFTLRASEKGGTLRIAPNAISSFNKTDDENGNQGAELILGDPTGQKLTFLLNGQLKNRNYSSLSVGMTVHKGAVLGGTGTIDYAVPNGRASTAYVSGTIAPGDPAITGGIGTLRMVGHLTWNSGADWIFQMKTPKDHDQIAITGDFNRGSGQPRSFTLDFAGTEPAAGEYKLITWTGKTTFTSGDFTVKNVSRSRAVQLTVQKDHLLATVVRR
jgi:hypothetical protein